MQFTRLLRNEGVTVEEISAHAAERTRERAKGLDVVAVQDTSELVLGARRARDNGYGPVGKGGKLGGLLLHVVLAVEASTGAVLGLIGLKIWNRHAPGRAGGRRLASGVAPKVAARRAKALCDKESVRWLEGAAWSGEVGGQASRVTCVSDRESDIYDHVALSPPGVELIVRATQDRRVEVDGEPGRTLLLFAALDALPEAGRFEATIPAAPGRRRRTAELAVRFSRVALVRPRHASCDLPERVEVAVVDVRETSPVPEGEPIHWRLVTTRDPRSLEEARAVIDLYRRRWVIEEFFRTLKTAGFDIESADIADPRAMSRFVAAAAVAAVTVMQLVQARDGTTRQGLAQAFDPGDQPLLEALCATLEGKTARQKNPHDRGTLAFAAWVIARLGGWDGYYGKPGPKVMRRGLDDFHRVKLGASLSLANASPHDV